MIAKNSCTPAAESSMDDLERVLERVKAHGVDPKDTDLLEAVIGSYG